MQRVTKPCQPGPWRRADRPAAGHLVHLACRARLGEPRLRALLDAPRAVLAPDRLGSARGGAAARHPPPRRPRAAGAQPPAVLAYNAGGPLAAMFAARSPERVSALVLYGCLLHTVRDEDLPWVEREDERDRRLAGLIE